ncbi:DUF11 domain-containing protein [Leptolyngbya cf. ectocarpi LEGE 11479]|uniref:DUF11 domain-containing protein n=1 Tax=Leptolyngbya cf. ectocarpi LEGE 11479 TaxID=1828722 RepID=A0A928ZRC8_LEPEC|nr:DUF11 domain-containing protein [Leptolyngbya ectocarpi]MBE9066388.1 DUF11 domain-containing protein [Leptolyngbya cf. ectocarpi LEGE 11479]
MSPSVMVTTGSDGCAIGQGIPDASIIPYISDEVRRNIIATRDLVDTLDDSWRTAVGQPVDPDLESWFGTAGMPQGTVNNFSYDAPGTNDTVNVSVELVQLPISGTECAGETTVSGSSPTLSNSSSLQSSAPRPASLYDSADQPLFWNDARGGASNDNQRNAILFSFAQPVQSFGLWVGDMETRTDGSGTPAILRLLDAAGNRIGQDIEIESTTLYDGNAPDPEIVNQSLCGGTTNNEPGCGNQSTRWVSFVDSSSVPRVQQVVLIVGDDDSATGNNDGDSEHISFIGANLANPPQVLLVKRITAINGNRSINPNDNTPLHLVVNDGIENSADDNRLWPTDFLLGEVDAGAVQPGDTIEYTVYFLNAGGSDAADVRICDLIQPHQQFVAGAYGNGDISLQIGTGTDATTYTLTSTRDAVDRAELATVDNLPPGPDCNLSPDANGTDTVVVLDLTGTEGSPVDLRTLPGAAGPTSPENAIGFMRFTIEVLSY